MPPPPYPTRLSGTFKSLTFSVKHYKLKAQQCTYLRIKNICFEDKNCIINGRISVCRLAISHTTACLTEEAIKRLNSQKKCCGHLACGTFLEIKQTVGWQSILE